MLIVTRKKEGLYNEQKRKQKSVTEKYGAK